MSILKKTICREQNAIIVIPDGCGKTSVLNWLGEEILGDVADETCELLDHDEWIVIPDATSEDSLIHKLWGWMGAPSPNASEFERRHTTGRRGPFFYQLLCHFCRRNCVLTQVKEIAGFGVPVFEDCDVQNGLGKISGCRLIRDNVLANISKFNDNLAIEVPPHLSSGHLEMLRRLAPNRKLLLLCPREAQAILRETFPNFPVKTPEPLSVGDLLAIYGQRLVDASMAVSPLPPLAVAMLALMSKGNACRFIEMVSDLIDKIEAEGITATVSVAWVGNKVGREIGNELAIQLLLSSYRSSGRDWISHTEIQGALRATFGLRLTRTKLGTILSDMGTEMKRRGKNKVVGYYIGDFVMVNNR